MVPASVSRPGRLFAAIHFMLGLALAATGPVGAADYRIPEQRDDGWPVAAAGSLGFDEAQLAALTAALQSGTFENTHAILVEKGGRLVYEAYATGEDERWGDPLGEVAFGPDTLHDLRSVTKSVTSGLLGIALAEADYDQALASPIGSFFPDLDHRFGEDLDQVTLHHVLTMTAGLQWNEMEVPYTSRDNDEIQLYYTADPVGLVLARPLIEKPGTNWYYNGGLTQVVAGLIERKTGKPIDRFAEEMLFAPLGIGDYEWLGSDLWPDDISPSAASGLRLTGRDLAKIGSLYLNQGQWQGKQVIPADWIARSVTRHVQDNPWGPPGMFGYGFFWYPGRTLEGDGIPLVRASGNGDQRIFVLPDQEIVVTIFAGFYNQRKWMSPRIVEWVLTALAGP